MSRLEGVAVVTVVESGFVGKEGMGVRLTAALMVVVATTVIGHDVDTEVVKMPVVDIDEMGDGAIAA